MHWQTRRDHIKQYIWQHPAVTTADVWHWIRTEHNIKIGYHAIRTDCIKVRNELADSAHIRRTTERHTSLRNLRHARSRAMTALETKGATPHQLEAIVKIEKQIADLLGLHEQDTEQISGEIRHTLQVLDNTLKADPTEKEQAEDG